MTLSDGTIVGDAVVLDNGRRKHRYNIVVMADGYTRPELQQFMQDVDGLVSQIQTVSPYADVQDAFNVSRVDVASIESGVDDPVGCGGTGAASRTYFDTSFCLDGVRRKLGCNLDTVHDVAMSRVPEWQLAVVIANSDVHGGTHFSINKTIVYSRGALGRTIAHEIGHALSLLDEYDYLAGCHPTDTGRDRYINIEPDAPNVTRRANLNPLKWAALQTPGTLVPTMENPNCAECDERGNVGSEDEIGAFEGAGTYHCDLFRPAYDCMMRHVEYKRFCAVCSSTIVAMLDRFRIVQDKRTLSDTAREGPALCVLPDSSASIAWTGTDQNHSLNLIHGIEAGPSANKITLPETSDHGPGLTYGQGQFFIAWTGTDVNKTLNVATSNDGANFPQKTVLPETSRYGPALAYGNGVTHLAWVGTDANYSINIATSTDGVTWNKVTLQESSAAEPGLSYINGLLYVLWRGTDAQHSLNVLSSADGATFGGKVTLTDTSDKRPALAYDGDYFLSWSGRDAGNRLNLLESADAATFSHKAVLRDSSASAPALASLPKGFLLSWTGTDSGKHVNVARVLS